MATQLSALEPELIRLFGENGVRVDSRERKVYSFDIGTMPKLVRPFVPAGLPGAIVRPQNEEQIRALAKLAQKHDLVLVPRAWGTSGYGGVLPQKGALVVDTSGMQQVLNIDAEALTVTVEPAAIWEKIDRALKKEALTLRMYPSSYPNSSAAGWLAQGGAGFGSYEFGNFKENVVSARVVLPSGEVKDFAGEELLNYVADAEGITGIITQLTLRIRPLEPEVHRLIAFPDHENLSAALQELVSHETPLWSLTFLNPESIRLKKFLPHRHARDWEKDDHAEPTLPEEYLAVIAYPASRAEAIEEQLAAFAAAHKGRFLDEEAAEHEWEQRFSPMRLKRTGPSLVPTEVIVPLDQLAAVLGEIERKIDQPFILEGMLARGGNVILLGFIPHDERSFAFNLAFALSLSVIKIAKAHGGSGFSTGLYFRNEADSILGKGRVTALKNYKQLVDPKGLFNPGKVIGSGFINTLMGVATALEPIIRPIANRATPPKEIKLPSKTINNIPPEVALMAYSCAKCGYCVNTCEQYSGRGWESHSPRGKYTIIKEIVEGREKWDQDYVNTILSCTTCEVCNARCQLQMPIEHNWMTLRGSLVHEGEFGTFPPFEMMAASLEGERDIWAGKGQNRANWVPEDIKPKLKDSGEILYFPGCTASFVENDIAEATTRLLLDAGYDLAYMGTDEACCGIPMKMAGKWDLFEDIYVHNTTEAKKRGAKTIVTSCPACALVWKEQYPAIARKRGEAYDFEVKHYSELIAPAIADGRIALDSNIDAKTITFHDSCHLGRAQGIYEEPREMLAGIQGCNMVEMEHNREEGYCCGSVITLIGEMEVAPVLGNMRLQEAVDAGADTVVAACPCCQVQLRDSVIKNELDLKVDDLARVVAQAAGYDIADTTDYSMYMWSYFERFIVLMKPEQMAQLMTRVFPQMLDAMPPGMKPMMLGMRHVPGGMKMMAKMMPLMFPMLAPSILAKVMPDLIAAVEDYIGDMPADMAELLPDLLPKTMDAMMPTYLPELIPPMVPLFIDYLENKAA